MRPALLRAQTKIGSIPQRRARVAGVDSDGQRMKKTKNEGVQSALHTRAYQPDAVGPLAGVSVLDLSRLFAGNALTQILADFGADVIKVEPTGGDTLRDWRTEGVSAHWKAYARNKKSLCLDLRRPEAIEIVRDLVSTTNVFIEGFRPGVLEAMGLTPSTLLALNPKLVIVRISGWGQSGPYANKPGFGTVIEGMSGFAAINGYADRPPLLPPMYLADGVAGLYGASATLIALRVAEAPEGKGQVIDLPLFDPLLAIFGPQAAHYRLTGSTKKRTGSRSTNSAPRNVYRCSDGEYIGLSGSTQTMARRIFKAIGRPELASDPKFSTNADRLRNVEELDAIIGDFVARHTQAEAVGLMERAQVTVGPIYTTAQILKDPHVVEREILADYEDSDMGLFPMHHVTPRLQGTPGAIRSPAPDLGEHNRDVLSRVGVDAGRYAKLVADGVVIAPEGKGA
jgi:crotonobetainyl-CoA:carnitine CoA-transferase CaiB-like acyl-CoA transferase